MSTHNADCVPHDGPGAVLWHEEQRAAKDAEYVCPDAPHSCTCTRRLERENDMLRNLLSDAVNGCSPEWIIDGLLHIDGTGEK